MTTMAVQILYDKDTLKPSLKEAGVTFEEWRGYILPAIEEVAAAAYPRDHWRICPIMQTGKRWWRIKERTTNTRTAVEFARIDGVEYMVVRYCKRRDANTYDEFEALFRAERVKAS